MSDERLPAGRTRNDEYAHLDVPLWEFATAASDDPARARLREQLVLGYRPVVVHIARRFQHRGEPVDDLEQAGMLGLLKALDRYDPDQAAPGGFLGFLVPTVTGEIRRHFRDRTWALHVPRIAKDLQTRLVRAQDELSARHRRAPRVSELAEHLGVDRESVILALQAREMYATRSLDTPTGDGGADIGDLVGGIDPALDVAEAREALRPALRTLPDRERTIVLLRFFGQQTQTEIAAQVGMSQMHVSRILAATLARLRRQMTADPETTPTHDRSVS